jgi:hypothetical protein
MVRFLPDFDNFRNSHMTTLQQSDRLPIGRVSVLVGVFGFRVVRVFGDHTAKRVHPRNSPRVRILFGCDPELFARIIDQSRAFLAIFQNSVQTARPDGNARDSLLPGARMA